ncbi:hypothetical protein H6F95_29710 [Cyanobacteria bacterium FACHB-471]|nr:hypothetical protein [Cyanobacteria bacterium FACHB-471]
MSDRQDNKRQHFHSKNQTKRASVSRSNLSIGRMTIERMAMPTRRLFGS